MSRFLTLIPYQTARTILKDSLQILPVVRTVPVPKATGYLSAEPVFSRFDVPGSNISTMDGYAVRSRETHSATEADPVTLTGFSYVHTGSPVENEYDAVVMQEDVRIDSDDTIILIKPARPGQNIQRSGVEMQIGKMVIPAGHQVLPSDIGALISYGIMSLQVKTLVAGIIPTGDELIEPYSAPKPGEVVASNSPMIAGYLEDMGIETVLYPITPDDPDRLKEVLSQAAIECSCIILTGGSSRGRRDHTKTVISELGEVLFHGVAMRPGRTVLAGKIEDVPVFGLPGTPVGAFVVLRELITPWLADNHFPVTIYPMTQATLAESVPSESGTDDFVQMVVAQLGGAYKAIPAGRGGQFSLIRSNAILHIPRQIEGFEAGSTKQVRITRFFPHPDSIVLISGESDPILDFLDQHLRINNLSLFHRQSRKEGAYLQLMKGSVHGAVIVRPCLSGSYQYMNGIADQDEPVIAVTLCDREYLLASRSVPESDTPGGHRCPLLPHGSVLHTMMEEYFKNQKIMSSLIERLEPECTTEQDIIRRIQTNEIDFGPCSEYQAVAAGLFGPVIGKESIDIIFREDIVDSEQVRTLRQVLQSEEWRQVCSSVPGYSGVRSGEISRFSCKQVPHKVKQ